MNKRIIKILKSRLKSYDYYFCQNPKDYTLGYMEALKFVINLLEQENNHKN